MERMRLDHTFPPVFYRHADILKILLAYSPAGPQAPENILLLLLFASEAGKKKQQRGCFRGPAAPLASKPAVSPLCIHPKLCKELIDLCHAHFASRPCLSRYR